MKKMLIMAITLIAVVTLFVGCTGIENVKSLELRGAITTDFAVGDELDLSGVSFKVTFTDDTTLILNGDDSRLVFTGFNTTTAGSKTMVFTYEGVTLEVPYTVYDQTFNSWGQIDDNKGLSNIRISGNITAATKIDFTQDTTIVGAECKLYNGSFVASNGAKVTFKNINFANAANKDVVLTVANGSFVFENCAFTRTGYSNYGVNGNGNNLEFNNCSFVTPTASDCFKYLVSNSADKINAQNVYKNCTIQCNFWYGISFRGNLTVDGCNIESTLTEETALKDAQGASYVNPNKQPVAFHSSAYIDGDNSSFNASVTNSTIKNVQNVFRVYSLDYITNPNNFNVTFTGNTLTNCNYAVNFSSQTYGHYAAMVEKMPTDLQAASNYRFVADRNTALTMVGETIGLTKTDSTFKYTGLQYVDKNGDVYTYVGYSGAHYILKDGQYYKLATAYSADGLDTRTITAVTSVPAGL